MIHVALVTYVSILVAIFVVSRLNVDVGIVQECLSSSFSILIRAIIVIVSCIGLMFSLSPALTGVLIACMTPLGWFTYYYGEKMRLIQKDISNNKGIMSTVAEESFGNVRTVKAFANEAEECQKFAVGNKRVREIGFKKAYWTAGFSFLQQIFLYGAMTIIIKVAVILYDDNKITIGTITSFYFYVL